MSEGRVVYTPTEDEAAALARLLEVFTPGQLVDLAGAMGEAIEHHYGRVEIEARNGRVFIWAGRSRDCGKVKKSPVV